MLDNNKIQVIKDYINDYFEANTYSPSVREIAGGTGIPRQTVQRYLEYMNKKGLVIYSGQRKIVTAEQSKTVSETLRVPVIGRIACGMPNLAEENIEKYVRLPVAIFGHGDFYLLRASGLSMIDIGIDDGDLVLIRKQNYAEEGDVIVALVETETTLKRYFIDHEKNKIRLHPENKDMEDIYYTNCDIQGVAVKVIKDIL